MAKKPLVNFGTRDISRLLATFRGVPNAYATSPLKVPCKIWVKKVCFRGGGGSPKANSCTLDNILQYTHEYN